MTLEKLKQEAADQKTDPQSKAVAEYVLQKCSESEDYAAKVQQESHTLDRCMKYVFYRAAEMNKKHEAMMMIGQDIVFGWVDDYYALDPQKEKNKIADADKLMNDLRMIRRDAMEQEKKKARPADKKPDGTKDEKKKPAEPEKPAHDVSGKEPEKSTDPVAKPPKEKKKPNKSLEGQFSLFDLM